jgi:hypothetical protein
MSFASEAIGIGQFFEVEILNPVLDLLGSLKETIMAFREGEHSIYPGA